MKVRIWGRARRDEKAADFYEEYGIRKLDVIASRPHVSSREKSQILEETIVRFHN